MSSAARLSLAKLAQGLEREVDVVPEVEGRLPEGLSGTLYRNGPGLFERNGFKKRNLLDGDGMIRAITLGPSGAHFRTRFVRTPKYLAEERAQRFLYPTWSTLAPSYLKNIPGSPSLSQAGVTTIVKQQTLYAFDEVGKPYGLHPESLDTVGEIDPMAGAAQGGPSNYKAHTKTDGKTGAWILVGNRGQRSPDFQVLVKDAAGRQLSHHVAANPCKQYIYYHDFFWADRYVVFHLHPAILSPFRMLLGLRPFVDSLSWKPEQGGVLLIIDTSGERAPITIDIPATWMWHSVNAFVANDTIIADFIGYDTPDHFIGPQAALSTIMQGAQGVITKPGTLRRFTIDLQRKRAQMENILDGHFEFPTLHPSKVGYRHKYAYVASGDFASSWFHTGVTRLDMERGAHIEYSFGNDDYVGEPLFAPNPAVDTESKNAEAAGWLLCEVFEGATEQSYVAVFDAEHIADGPLAKVRLPHHLPFSFHGWWEAR